MSYLDKTGLIQLWGWIRSKFGASLQMKGSDLSLIDGNGTALSTVDVSGGPVSSKTITIPVGTTTSSQVELFRLIHTKTPSAMATPTHIVLSQLDEGRECRWDIHFANNTSTSPFNYIESHAYCRRTGAAGLSIENFRCFYRDNSASTDAFVFTVNPYSKTTTDVITLRIDFYEEPDDVTVSFEKAGDVFATATSGTLEGVSYTSGSFSLRVNIYHAGNISGTAASPSSFVPAFFTSYHYAGEALAASRIVMQAADGKIYLPTNTTVAYDKDIKVFVSTTAVNSGSAITYSNTRTGIDVAASSYLANSFVTHDTYTRYHKYYAQFTCRDGKFYSDNILRDENARIAGKYYLYIGHMSRSTSYIEMTADSQSVLVQYLGADEGTLLDRLNSLIDGNEVSY